MQYPHECIHIHTDYMITLLLSLFFHCALWVCVCRVGLRIRMSTSDELISVKRKKTGKKKTPTRPLPLRFYVRSSYWRLVYRVSVVARHRRPKDIRLSKEKKGGKTETDMQSKAMEGVPVVHTHTKTPFLIFLSIFLHLCWSSLPIFFLSFSSCWFNLHGLLHHYHRPFARWKKKSTSCIHIKGQLDRATRTIKEWVTQEHDFSFIIVIMPVEASSALFFTIIRCFLSRNVTTDYYYYYYYFAIGHFWPWDLFFCKYFQKKMSTTGIYIYIHVCVHDV
jgi:hypothetical protein